MTVVGMNYKFREREAQWSDLALLCCDMKPARKLGARHCLARAEGRRKFQPRLSSSDLAPDFYVL